MGLLSHIGRHMVLGYSHTFTLRSESVVFQHQHNIITTTTSIHKFDDDQTKRQNETKHRRHRQRAHTVNVQKISGQNGTTIAVNVSQTAC